MTGRRNTDFQSADILSAVPSAGYKPAGRTGHKACVPGSIRVWRVSFGASPKRSRVHGKVRDHESAIAPSRSADANSARLEDGIGIERNSILVHGNASSIENFLRLFAIDFLVAQVHQHQMIVCSAANDAITVFAQTSCERFSICHHLLLIGAKLRL